MISSAVDILVGYDSVWPGLYVRERNRILGVLPGAELSRVGSMSMSVPGLAAKPVIDVLLVVADSDDEDAYVPALVRAGYYLRLREPGWYRHRLLKVSDPEVNLHVFSPACADAKTRVVERITLRALS